MIRVEHDEQGNVRVGGDAVVHEAEALRDGLVEALDRECEQYWLDLGQLTSIDSAGVQLFLSFRQAAKQVAVHSCPDRIRQSLERVGVARHLL